MRSRVIVAFITTIVLAPFMARAASVNDQFYSQQWGLQKIQAAKAWDTSAGTGVTIAVVDTGVDLFHGDLRANLVPGRDFVDADPPQDDTSSSPDPDDPGCPGNPGHGTHVAGIAAAVANNGTGIVGVAPRARIMPVRVLNKYGCGYFEDVDKGIRWAAENGAQVINLSLGELGLIRNVLGSGIKDAIEYAWSQHHVVVVVAAGNDVLFPSGYRDVDAIVVAATNQNDERDARYSNLPIDAKWGMAAPGTQILSTLPGNRYANLSGTSMATPHVAGAAGALRCLGLNEQQTVDRLLSTADKLGPDLGSGRLNVARAVEGRDGRSCQLASAPGQVPSTPSGGSSSLSGATSSPSSKGPTAGTQGKPTTASSPGAGAGQPESGETGGKAAAEEDEKDRKRGNTAVNLILTAVLALGILGAVAWARLKSRIRPAD